MWQADGSSLTWRQQFFQQLATPVDVLVIGGGITGAGVLLAAAQRGWRAALVEQKDFSWGSSSRSSKLVHGGLRYLKQGRFGLTRSALRERNALQRDYPELVAPRRFFLPYSQRPNRMIQAGLCLYDGLAGQHSRAHHDRAEWLQQFPTLNSKLNDGALSYLDAATDDSSLVMAVLQQAAERGGLSCNYAAAEQLLTRHDGSICGARIRDQMSERDYEVTAKIVINATGAWCSQLTPPGVTAAAMRPLRGSHLVLPFHRLPISEAIGCQHPQDGRPVYAVPWAGAVLFGTTDVEHSHDLNYEPHLNAWEYDYLMAALDRLFPELGLNESDLLSSFAGVRPTFADGALRTSETSREHRIQHHRGWLSISGGKLTTFRAMANAVLAQAEKQLQAQRATPNTHTQATQTVAASLFDAPHYLASSDCTARHWQQLLHHSAVQHLDDLMLRRSRIGLVEADGGLKLLQQQQQTICQALQWSASHWQLELRRYQALWNAAYAPQAFRHMRGESSVDLMELTSAQLGARGTVNEGQEV